MTDFNVEYWIVARISAVNSTVSIDQDPTASGAFPPNTAGFRMLYASTKLMGQASGTDALHQDTQTVAGPPSVSKLAQWARGALAAKGLDAEWDIDETQFLLGHRWLAGSWVTWPPPMSADGYSTTEEVSSALEPIAFRIVARVSATGSVPHSDDVTVTDSEFALQAMVINYWLFVQPQ